MKTDRVASVPALLTFLSSLTDQEMLALLDNHGEVKEHLGGLVAEEIQNTYVIALSDNELREQFPQFADRLPSWRKVAAALDYRGPVAWKVRAGFTLKKHAPLAGPCYNNLNYLQDWSLKDDDSTRNSIVFWVPRLAPDSTNKSFVDMEPYRDELKQEYGLPEHHAVNFGPIALNMALILAHFKRTGERVPLKYLYAVSDTLRADGDRLVSGNFREDGLHCFYWDEDALAGIGFFLQGVEVLEQ